MLITPTWTSDRNASRSLRVIESDIGMASETRGRKPDSRRLDRDRRPFGGIQVPIDWQWLSPEGSCWRYPISSSNIDENRYILAGMESDDGHPPIVILPI